MQRVLLHRLDNSCWSWACPFVRKLRMAMDHVMRPTIDSLYRSIHLLITMQGQVTIMTDCPQSFILRCTHYAMRRSCLRFILLLFLLQNIFLLFSAWAWPVDPIPIASIGLKSFAQPESVWPTELGESHCTTPSN
jgi:hypothetical protein